MLESQSKAQKT